MALNKEGELMLAFFRMRYSSVAMMVSAVFESTASGMTYAPPSM